MVAGAVAFVSGSRRRGFRPIVSTGKPLSEQAIARALAENKRVFVDVTADWCVTCKANKYNVLLRTTQDALSAPDVVALRGDWSPLDTISQFLTTRAAAPPCRLTRSTDRDYRRARAACVVKPRSGAEHPVRCKGK